MAECELRCFPSNFSLLLSLTKNSSSTTTKNVSNVAARLFGIAEQISSISVDCAKGT